tara:strand:- start:237 stop:515 length:279 start_codon:yes stop_codon:yes gene_type:complete
MKTFKCVLWASEKRLAHLNKKNPKDDKQDMPFIIETKYVECKSYEDLIKSYRLDRPGTYCLVENDDRAIKKDAIEVPRKTQDMSLEGSTGPK